MGIQIPHHLLNQSHTCECGRNHVVPIEQIVVGDDFLDKLHRYIADAGFKQVLVVADTNTKRILGAEVHDYLVRQGIQSKEYTLHAHHDLLPDREAIDAVRAAIVQHEAQLSIAVGSGVINDVVRYAAFQEEQRYVVVPTAPSMDGYASSVAALQFDGVKTTLPAQVPTAIFASPRVLAEAPWPLIQSGFGDLLGKAISLMDWRLAHRLYGEYLCEQSYAIVLEPLEYCIEHASALRSRDQEAAKNLFIGLINAGIAMAMVGNSRPCSGSEHHCSHFWDLAAFKGERDHAAHGLQVGHAVHYMAQLYRQLAHMSELAEPKIPQVDEAFIAYAEGFYGDGAHEVIRAQQEKVAWLTEHHPHALKVNMNSLREELHAGLQRLDDVTIALDTMGIAHECESIGVSQDLLERTFWHASELRARYTVFDFLRGQGRLEEAIHDVLA